MKKCRHCDMKGFLSFIVLLIISKSPANGTKIAAEIEKRKGSKPSPGTIYPVLKELKDNKLITADNTKTYSLTKKGKEELNHAKEHFCCIFYDMKEIMKGK